MISILFLILIFIWFYKKRTSYNPYDISLSHSSYYECAFCREEKCTEEVLRILEPVAGHKRILKNVFLQGEKDGRAGADVVMIHESGIYVIHSANLEGVIAGTPQGRYWKQTFREGWLLACRNYLYNPFLENKKILDVMQWEFRDMPWLPYYSFAVFGNRGVLLTSGWMGENCFSLPVHALSSVVADVFRHNRRFLKEQDIERIYERMKNTLHS